MSILGTKCKGPRSQTSMLEVLILTSPTSPPTHLYTSIHHSSIHTSCTHMHTQPIHAHAITHTCTHTRHTHSSSHSNSQSQGHTHAPIPTFTHSLIHAPPPPPSSHIAAGLHTYRQVVPDLSTGLLHICSLVIPTGELGRLLSMRELVDSGIQSFTSSEDTQMSGEHTILDKFQGPEQGSATSCQWINVGAGLPALPKKLVERIRANEYIDFADLPPAKGKSRPLLQSLEGHVIVVQAADLAQPRRVIPDLATWSQCFALYVAVLAPSQPRLADLMAYQSLIAKVSAKFKWPSWVVYDQNFQQDAVGNPQLAWAKVDPSTYAQCFTNQAISRENWCEKCQSLDHTSGNCPSRPRKRPWSAMTPQAQPGSNDDVCKKYNRFNGDCKFGKECRYLHICLKCREPHPISRCKANSTGGSSTGSSSRPPA